MVFTSRILREEPGFVSGISNNHPGALQGKEGNFHLRQNIFLARRCYEQKEEEYRWQENDIWAGGVGRKRRKSRSALQNSEFLDSSSSRILKNSFTFKKLIRKCSIRSRSWECSRRRVNASRLAGGGWMQQDQQEEGECSKISKRRVNASRLAGGGWMQQD